MSYYGSDTTYIGSGYGLVVPGLPLTEPDPTQDYIAGAFGRLLPRVPHLLSQDFDDVTRNFGARTYEAMLTDPAVYSSYLALKLAILSGPMRVIPVYQPTKGGDLNLGPKESRAKEVADFCDRLVSRLRSPFKSTLLQWLDAMAFGNRLAEKVYEVCEDGQDKGKLVFSSVKVKPAWAWKFLVDNFLNIQGILTYIIIPPEKQDYAAATLGGGWMILPREKFGLLSWLPRDNDPRGTSALRAAYDWWNLKRQCTPFYYQHLRRFGSPSLDGELPPGIGNTPQPAIDLETGEELVTQAFVSPAKRFFQQLQVFQNGSIIVRPAGSKLNIVEPNNNGESFLKAFDLFDRQIVLAIQLQTRTALEAKFGSKADSETGQDTRGLVISYARELLGEAVRRELFYDCVKMNFGAADADEFTPLVDFGASEIRDLPALWSSAANLYAAGYLGASQLPQMDADLLLPPRDAAADAEAERISAEQETDRQMKLASAKRPEPTPGGQNEP